MALAPWCAFALAQTTTALPAGFHRRRHSRRGPAARVSEGTVYNYLPVNIGDHLNPQRVREAIKALYATGFFRDVQMRREGNTLVVVVLRAPLDPRVSKSPATKTSRPRICRNRCAVSALPPARQLDRSVLEDVTQYLTDQYFARGKCGVRIDTKVEEESGNRVKIKIDIKEGTRAKDPQDQHRRSTPSSRTRRSLTPWS